MAEWLNSLRLRLRALLRGRRLEQDLRDEVAFHLAMREEQLRNSGNGDARVAARRRFGNTTRIREDLRDSWALAPRFSALLADFRYAARTLRRTPAFTIVVVLTLGAGMGANTAFFSVVNAALIRPLGYPRADALVMVYERFGDARAGRLPFSALDYEDLRTYQRSFEGLGAFRNVPFELSGDGSPQRVTGARVSAGLFETLGVHPALGRSFSRDDDRPGANVAILSWTLWQRRFGGDHSVLGRLVQLDRQPFTVVGVMPARFVFPRRGPEFNSQPADVWIPIAFTQREQLERGSNHANSVIARMKEGVRFEGLQPELDEISRRITANYPPFLRSAGFSPALSARPLREDISGAVTMPLLMLLAAVGLVLLVACANVANLILSRAASRTREFAVRVALGARRAQLARLLLCEALLLSAAGAVTGVALAYGAARMVPSVLVPTIPGLQELTIDVRVLAFTAAMCLGTAVLFALVPVASLGARGPGDSLRADPARATAASARVRVQRALVVVTVSLACILLLAAGLFIRSFAALVGTDSGFRGSHVLTASMTLPRTFYASAASVRSFHDSLTRQLGAMPGVRSVAIATDLPFTTYDMRVFTPEGSASSQGAHSTTNVSWVHGPYFETLGIDVRRGRSFTADEYGNNRNVVIVNERLAALTWPREDPVGKRMKWGVPASTNPWLTVVGVIANVADGPIGAEPKAHAYEPFRQIPDLALNGGVGQFGRDVKVALLSDAAPGALAASLRQEIANLDRELALENVRTMDEQVSDVVAPRRFSALLVGAFAGISLALASIGLYGLLAFTTALRQKEVAVRMALGARRSEVVRMVIGQGARLVAIGLVLGLAASLVLTKFVASLLYRTSPWDVLSIAAVPAVLVPVALIACAIPGWRASRADAMAVLRTD